MQKKSLFVIALALASMASLAPARADYLAPRHLFTGQQHCPRGYVLHNGRCYHERDPLVYRQSWQPSNIGVPAGRPGYGVQQRTGPAAQDANFKRAQQQAMCDEQVAKRRALGVPSVVEWYNNGCSCRATGGMVETGRI